jgi:hypothetical protein
MEAEDLKQEKKEGLKDTVGDLFNHSVDYLNTFYKLAIVKATEKATKAAAGALSAVVVAVLGFFMLFFLVFGLAWWVGDLINSRAGGFFIVSGFFFLLIIVLVMMSKRIVFPYFRDRIIRKLYE